MRYTVVSLILVLLLLTSGCTFDIRSAASAASTATPTPHVVGVARAAQPTATATTARAKPANPPSPSPTSVPPTAATNTSGAALPTITAVADAVRPAVVFIAVEGVTADQFFQPVPVSGVGSGVIYDPNGFILTNNHVIENARTIRVVLPDGRDFPARLVGRDPQTDLAVLKIDGQNLPTAPLGNSDQLRIGEWVIAIGNALGLEGGPTVTVGVVSALGRSIEVPNGAVLENLIQTDAAINPGNSGGPLINLKGEVVGINTAAPGPTQTGFQPSGIGFAISINSARPIIDDLVQHGRVRRAWLGVGVETLTPGLAARLGISVREGIVVGRVVRGSPAARAGLQPGDVIVGISGTPITNTRDLSNALRQRNVGDRVVVEVVRDGRRMQTTIALEEAPGP